MSPTEEDPIIRGEADRETQTNGWPPEYAFIVIILWLCAIGGVLLAVFWPS